MEKMTSQRIKPYTFAIATANAQTKIAKEYVLANAINRTEIKYENTTKYKNNSRNRSKYEHCSPQQH